MCHEKSARKSECSWPGQRQFSDMRYFKNRDLKMSKSIKENVFLDQIFLNRKEMKYINVNNID